MTAVTAIEDMHPGAVLAAIREGFRIYHDLQTLNGAAETLGLPRETVARIAEDVRIVCDDYGADLNAIAGLLPERYAELGDCRELLNQIQHEVVVEDDVQINGGDEDPDEPFIKRILAETSNPSDLAIALLQRDRDLEALEGRVRHLERIIEVFCEHGARALENVDMLRHPQEYV